MSMTAFELLGMLKMDSSDFDKGLSKAESSAKSFGNSVAGGILKADLIKAGFKAATDATVRFAKEAVDKGSQFDAAMGQVAATGGTTVEEMNSQIGSVETAYGHFEGTLRDFALFMGQNTVFSATEAGEALNYMALAGYDLNDSMNMLPAVLDMAAAGSMDLAKASDVITDTQSALNLSFERTNLMVDEWAKAASTGNTSVEQLGDAFLTVGGLATELNGGFVTLADGTQVAVDGVQELEIAFTAMANSGVKGTEAGTHMRNMLLKLASPTKDGTAALDAMGVSIFDAEGNMRSLSEIFGDLNTALGQMTQEDRISVISDLFNTRDMASAEALLGAINQDWDAIGASILEAEGSASQMSQTKLDNLQGDMTLFNSALETAYITINDQLSPILRDFVQFGTSGLQQLVNGFNEGGLSGAMKAFGNILSDGVKLIMEKLPSIIDAGMQVLGAFGQGILDNLPVLIDVGVQIINQLVSVISQALPALQEGAFQILSALGAAIIENLPTLVETALQMIYKFMEYLVEALPGAVGALTDLILGLGQMLIDNAPMLIDAALALIIALADGLIEALPELIPGVVEIVLAIVMKLTEPETLMKLIQAAIELAMAILEGLLRAIPDILNAIPELISNLVGALVGAIPLILEAAILLFNAILTALIELIPQIILVIPRLILAIVGGLKKGIVAIARVGKDMVEGLWNGIKSRWEGLVRDFKNLATGLVDRIKAIFGIHSPSRVFRDEIGRFLAEGMEVGFEEQDPVGAIAKNINSGLADINGELNDVTVSGSVSGGAKSVLAQMDGNLENAGRDLTVILEIDRTQFARAVYRMNNAEMQRVGVNLAGGYA